MTCRRGAGPGRCPVAGAHRSGARPRPGAAGPRPSDAGPRPARACRGPAKACRRPGGAVPDPADPIPRPRAGGRGRATRHPARRPGPPGGAGPAWPRAWPGPAWRSAACGRSSASGADAARLAGVGGTRARGQHGPARGLRRVLVHGRPAARDRLLARRAPLHGQDHAGATIVRRGAAVSLRGTRRRLGRGFPGAARGRLGATLARRLDLEHARPAEVGDRRVDRTRHRIVERLHQRLAGRDHRRQRCRRKGCHPEGDNQGCVAARRHARRSPAARLDGWVTARQASAYRS